MERGWGTLTLDSSDPLTTAAAASPFFSTKKPPPSPSPPASLRSFFSDEKPIRDMFPQFPVSLGRDQRRQTPPTSSSGDTPMSVNEVDFFNSDHRHSKQQRAAGSDRDGVKSNGAVPGANIKKEIVSSHVDDNQDGARDVNVSVLIIFFGYI